MIPTFGMLGVLHTAKQYRGCYHEGSNKEHARMYLISKLRNNISPVSTGSFFKLLI